MYATSGSNLSLVNANPKYPIFKLEYYDTPYGVPTLGYGFAYYNDPDQNSNLDFASDSEYENIASKGKDNILSYDWGFGSPVGVNDTGYYKGKFYGWFYAKYQGTYSFRLFKEPNDYAQVYRRRDSSGVVSDPSVTGSYGSTTYRMFNDWGADHTAQASGTWTLVVDAGAVNKWHPLTILYAQREKGAYLTAQYLEPDGVISPVDGSSSDYDTSGTYHMGVPVEHWKTLSAGVFAYNSEWANGTYAQFIQPSIIDCAVEIGFDKSFNQSNTIVFRVPLLNVDSTSGLKGFRYDVGNSLYIDDNTNRYLRQGRLVKYYAGYSSSGASPEDWNYIQRFEGIITDIKVNRRSHTDANLEVTCQDILYNAVSSINENYPDNSSYDSFNFRSANNPNEPNGVSRPMAYDSWPLVDAVRDLYTKAGIDPTKLYGRKTYTNRNGFVVTGDYLIQDRDIVLRRRVKYGNPHAIGSTFYADDEYIWASNFGDYIYDSIAKMADNYGFVVEASPDGCPTFYSVNSANTFVCNSGWIDTGTFTISHDVHADGGQYLSSVASGGILITGFTGSAVAINYMRYNVDVIDDNLGSWGIIENELSDGLYDYDYSASTKPGFANQKFGYLYGIYPDPNTTYENGHIPNDLRFLNTTIIVRPQIDITAKSIKYYSRTDFPMELPRVLYDAADIGAEVYFGKITPPDYDTLDLITSSLVVARYIRRQYGTPIGDGRYGHIIAFDDPAGVDLASGQTYAFKFVTRNFGSSVWAKSWSYLFSIENTMRLPDTGTNKIHMTVSKPKLSDYSTDYSTITPDPYKTDFQIEYNNSSDDVTTGGGIFANFTLVGVPQRYATITILGQNTNLSYTEISSWDINMNYYDPNNSATFRFPSDGPNKTGLNPCVFFISANDIGNDIGEGIISAYGNYIIQIEDKSSVNSGTNICSIDVYDTDYNTNRWSFSTSKNIKSLGYEQSIDDVRNDIVVIGDLISTVKDYFTKENVNVNNPTYDYVYSRAIDVSSISNPDSLNNVGKKKPFIIYQPSIVDQKHADWFAQTMLSRYNRFRDIPQWESFGIPFLEPNDKVSISDDSNGVSLFNNSEQWIHSISEKITLNNYSMSFSTTPYPPWGSFVPRPAPVLSGFNNNAFVNVRLTDTNNVIRGRNNVEADMFDVYESETSGIKLRVKYDQVIDGDIIVKVVSQQVMGLSSERTIAYLVGALQDGLEVPEYRQWGTDYELLWDGVDQTGNARSLLGQSVSNIQSSGLVVTINDYDYIADYREPGFYAASGQYFIRFIINPRDRNIPRKIIDSNKLESTYNTEMFTRLGVAATEPYYPQYWELKWGDTAVIEMLVSGDRPSSAERDLRYYPNNHFYNDEYGGGGPKFTFNIPDAANHKRLLYYNVSVDHIWGIGYTFVLRQDAFTSLNGETYTSYTGDNTYGWYRAYNRAIAANYSAKNKIDSAIGSFWYRGAWLTSPAGGDLDIRNLILTNENRDRFKEGILPLDIPSRQTIVRSGSDYRVYAWCEMPYVQYKVDDYIPTRIHRFNNNNPIVFQFNPQSALGGGWEHAQIPDIPEEHYDRFRRYLTLAAYYSGRTTNADKRLQLMTSHAFQVNTLIWDNTGRILTNSGLNIAKPMAAHQHQVYAAGLQGTLDDVIPLHTHSDQIQLINGVQTDAPQEFKLNNVIYDMTTPNGTFNYGNGYCNISGLPNYSFWSWHGYWHNESDSPILQKIPFEHWKFPDTQHWCRYPMPYESGGLLKYAIPDIRSPKQDGAGYDKTVVFDNVDGLSQSAAEASGAAAFVDFHMHHPIYEGLNQSSDPYGFISYAISGLGLPGSVDLWINLTSRPAVGSDITDNDYSLFLHYNPEAWYYIGGYGPNADSVSGNRLTHLVVSSDFPNIWYKLNVQFPWDSNASTLSYWTNFLTESGFSFFRGGWADLQREKG